MSSTGAASGAFGFGEVFADEGGRFTPKNTSGFANGWGPFHGTTGIIEVLLFRKCRHGRIVPSILLRLKLHVD
jgi:hypothetical protein